MIFNADYMQKLYEKKLNDEVRKTKSAIGLSTDIIFEISPMLSHEEFYLLVMALSVYDQTGEVPNEMEEELKSKGSLYPIFKLSLSAQKKMYNSWLKKYKATEAYEKRKQQKTGSENPEVEEIVPVMDNDYIVRRIGNHPEECDCENGVYSGLRDLQGYTMENVVHQILGTTKEQISDILCVYPEDITDKIEKAELIEIQHRLKEKI